MGMAIFLFFNNKDQCLYNKDHQVTYTARYVCFIRSKGNYKINNNWQQKYLDGSQIDYNTANKLVADDFLLKENNFKYCSRLMRYI